MKKTNLKIAALFLCVLIVSFSSVTVFAQDGWGKFGSGIKWHFYEKTGLLKITGKGAMPGQYTDFDDLEKKFGYGQSIPWRDYSSQIKKVTIGSGITAVCDNAFYGYPNLASISFPRSLRSIGRYAVCKTSIKSLKLPSKLKRLGFSAFYSNKKLKTVSIPGSLKTIPLCCFEFCENLTAVKIGKGVREIIKPFQSTAIKTITIPSSVKTLDAAFSHCKQLRYAIVPKTVTSMKGGVFAYCSAMKYADIQGKVDIEKSCFSGCTSLKAVRFGNKVKSIGYFSFWNCSNLQGVFVPRSVKKIDNDAFYDTKQSFRFFTYSNSAGYDYAGIKSNIVYVNVAKGSGMSKWKSLWKKAKN